MMEQGGGSNIFSMIIQLAITVAAIAGMWKTFEKAGKPGWAALIPIYNAVVLFQIAGKNPWWILSIIIFPVFIVMYFIVVMQIAVSFGKSKVWGFFLLGILYFIGYPMLGFGDATYSAPPPPA